MGAKIIYLEQLREFLKRHPHIKQVRQGYGASELSGGAMNSMTPDEYLEDCENCGRLLPGMQAKVVEPASGRLLGPNETGILHIRGGTVFPGYYDRKQMRLGGSKQTNGGQPGRETPFINGSDIFDSEGFYISGDLAYFNDKEQLYIKGRQKEVMSCRCAKKVLPQELEGVIDQHPAVHKVCVLGIANKRELTVQCPRAFVVVKSSYYTADTSDEAFKLSTRLTTLTEEGGDEAVEGTRLEFTSNRAHPLSKLTPDKRRLIAEDLMMFVNERVGWYKQLTGGIVLLDDIPTSRATGKFDKNYLRSLSQADVEIFADQSG